MRFPIIIKYITRLISIIIICSAIVTLPDIVINIRNHSFFVFMRDPTFILFAVACILLLTLGPYAAFHLWNFRRKGRIASLALIIYSLFYNGYILYMDQVAQYVTLVVWVSFIAAFVALLFLSLPSISRLFNPDKDGTLSWYRRAWKNLSAVQAFTISISFLALIISFFNIFFAHIYRPDKLLATVTNISFAKKEFSFLVTFINSGSAYAVVQGCNICLATKQDLKKDSFGKRTIHWITSKDSKAVPKCELILKPGEIKIIRMYSKQDVPNTIKVNDSDDLLIALSTQTMDSGGRSYMKESELGTAQVKNGKIVGLRRDTSNFYVTPTGGSTSELSGEDIYGIILKLH